MAIQYTRLPFAYAVNLTTRLIAIATSPETRVTLANSATEAVFIQNNGPASIAIGGSGVLVDSSDVLFPYTPREFNPVQSNFTFYAVATSVQSVLAFTEFRR